MNIAEDRKLAAEAKALAEGATRAPWKPQTEYDIDARYIGSVDGPESDFFFLRRPEDTAFIAASRTLVPDLADRLVAALDRVEELERENSVLKGIIADSDLPCLYCGLVEWPKCSLGFPGCGRADDVLCDPRTNDEKNEWLRRQQEVQG